MRRKKRRFRSKHGQAVPYQCLSTFGLWTELFGSAFMRLTTFWGRLEVSGGGKAEFLPVLTYRMRDLIDRDSPWWVVAYTDVLAKTTAYIRFEVYD